MCTCAPSIEAELDDWVSLGGQNWGCCGDENHPNGFHVPARLLPITDYSRRHEVGKPYDMDWACAGDYAHMGNSILRAQHAVLLSRLMTDDASLSMVCEFIGQPWEDKPVYYWARWNGVATLKKYTGNGHDKWSHISLWRSRANERPYLWLPKASTPEDPKPKPAPIILSPVVYPPWPGRFIQYRSGWSSRQRYRGADVRKWQQKMKDRGWRITVDSDFGAASDKILRAFQQEKGLRRDGILGPISWKATWTKPK